MSKDQFISEEVQEEAAPQEDKANQEMGEKEQAMPCVPLQTRLQTRVLDLRVPTNRAIFKINSTVCHLFREFFFQKDFIEIHSPKILGGSSEGGSEVFSLKYFEKDASLAQSPQLFKQMALMGDFAGVYEIGPVFRAENSNTHRHLCEFTGLDMEMEIKESYLEVCETIGQVFKHIFEGLNRLCAEELATIQEQFAFEPFVWSEETVMLSFEEATKLLNEAGFEQDPKKDFERPAEAALGKIVREKYNTDFYIVHRYPDAARPFYSMPCGDDAEWSCSYDVFMRGTEIISGAQRVHDSALARERALAKGVNAQDIEYYFQSFEYGATPHGGFGVGLERVVKLFLDLHSVRQTSLFPRTPKILIP